jgi:hypothetical protein
MRSDCRSGIPHLVPNIGAASQAVYALTRTVILVCGW